ncbi:TPA: hypothetical protein SG253_001741 [Campylobacter jejuni]|nr:hypothetical protein [Campylobacter jejuni]
MDNEYLFDVKYKNIGKLNNLHKMLYGRKKAFEMMEKYEKQNNKKYDFVLIVRPDLDYYPIEIEILKTINNNEVIGTHEIFPHQNEILDFFLLDIGILFVLFVVCGTLFLIKNIFFWKIIDL